MTDPSNKKRKMDETEAESVSDNYDKILESVAAITNRVGSLKDKIDPCSMEIYAESSSSEEEIDSNTLPLRPTYDELKHENEVLRQELEILRLRNAILETEHNQIETIPDRSDGRSKSTEVKVRDEEDDNRGLCSPPRRGRRRLSYDSPNPKSRNPFTNHDRLEIVRFIRRNRIRHAGINTGVWEKMKNEVFFESPHTVQSLENHFRKYILPKLDKVISCETERVAFETQLESPSPIKKRKF